MLVNNPLYQQHKIPLLRATFHFTTRADLPSNLHPQLDPALVSLWASRDVAGEGIGEDVSTIRFVVGDLTATTSVGFLLLHVAPFVPPACV